MEMTDAVRIPNDHLRGNLRKKYWEACKAGTRFRRLLRTSNRDFASHVAKDLTRYLLGAVRSISGETRERAEAAAAWIVRAQDAVGDGGVSHGYFPCEEGGDGWRASYPETTGYIITSFLEYARCYGAADLYQRALTMARWEIQIQMSSGAVQGGRFGAPEKQTPCTFNTGMVLDGWCSAYRASGERIFLSAGQRAANYLVLDLTEDGYFRTNGQFVAAGEIKTYNCLCAWPLYRFAQEVEDEKYSLAALKIVDAALRQQHSNGWFANNCLSRPEAPLLHTIAYTLQGILEVGVLAGRPDYIEAVRRGLDPVLAHLSHKGFLPGCFYSDWKPAILSSCLTGSAQTAIVCYRFYEHTGLRQYWVAAEKIVNYLKALQETRSPNPAINGALAGSFPIVGEYMPMAYPNWATKYFLDDLMLQDRLKVN